VDSIKAVPQHDQCVVSRYIDNPLLLYGHKFDMRIYVVVTCYDPLRIYVYREGLVRIASDKYTSSDRIESMENRFAHLTNYSVNKKNENYHQKEAG
jgi:tubulin polyglutamylase TTLL4